jgi:penicillin-binding protein 2
MAGPSVAFKDHWQEQRLFLSRLIAACIIVLFLTGVLVGRLVQLQVVDYQRYSELSQGNRFKIEPLPPTRGIIYDRNGLVIADNQPDWQLVAVPEEVNDLEATLIALENLELVDPSEHDELLTLVRSHRGFERVKISSLNEEQASRFAVRRHHFAGIDIQEVLTRSYPFGEASAHAVGYVGSISTTDLERIERSEYAGTQHIGKSGIERAYEAVLHGRVGYRQQVVNAQGRVLFDPAVGGPSGSAGVAGVETKWPVPGANLVLALDMRLQLATQEAMKDARGASVVIDTTNGDVLALVSTPSFDPNRFATGLSRADYVALNTDPDKPLLNRALGGRYPPGSTMKPFLALAALQYEAVDPGKTVFCPGHFRLPGQTHRYRDWRPQGHGQIDMHQAIVQSCDVYFYNLALALGIDNMASGMAAFGFGAPTGLDISGESAGIVPTREWKARQFSRREDKIWFPGETVITGIGQGFTLVTPVQLAHAGAVLAARGKNYKPRLLIGTEDALTRETTWIDPVEQQGIDNVDPEHWQTVHDAMVGVTNDPRGSGRASMLGAEFQVAGKTGTAQVVNIAQDEKYDEKELDERLRDHGLFVAYAPIDAPRIAVGVVIENGGGGSRAAAPIARKIFDAYFAAEGYVASEP